MNADDLVDKTEQGQQEIRARSAGLAPRVRTVLIMVDGRKTVAQLKAAAEQLGAPADSLDTLLKDGLVALRSSTSRASSSSSGSSGSSGPSGSTGASASSSSRAAAAPAAAPSPAANDNVSRVDRARQYINDTVVDAVGVRAVFFTLKIERCYTSQDLEALLPEFERLLSKARSPAEAQLSVQRARELLG